jgi:predicted ATP-dependent endonuclease of OLD family
MIKRIHIKNFRSIQEIEILPNSLCSIIGPNSVGKTNILKALDLILGEGWATKAKVAKELFHDVTKPISIRVDFTKPINHKHYEREVLVEYITLHMEMYPEFKCEVRLRNYNDDVYFVNDEFKRKCHFIYIPAYRDLTGQMRVSNWTLLGKLMKEIYQNYINFYGNEDQLQQAFKTHMEAPKEFLENDFDKFNLTFKKFSDSFIKNCETNSSGFSSTMTPELNIYNLNWFYKTLQISVTESNTNKKFDSDEVGSGMQNLILLSTFQTYAELIGGSVIFGIEEPEIYLYPQAQRALFKNFQTLSANSQIFYTTHNPNFIDAGRAYEIEIIKKDSDRGTYNTKKASYINQIQAEHQRFKIYSHFNTERNEVFFAKKAILVEGDSDKIFYSTIIENVWKLDIDCLGISIISCNGKGGVAYFSGLCEAMGMEEFFSIWDADEELERTKPLESVNEKGRGLELAPNLEGFLSAELDVKFSNNNKIKEAYEVAQTISEKTLPVIFKNLYHFITDTKPEVEGIPVQ